jgi:hypothetical protein
MPLEGARLVSSDEEGILRSYVTFSGLLSFEPLLGIPWQTSRITMCHSSSPLPAVESVDLDNEEVPNTCTHSNQCTLKAVPRRGANNRRVPVSFCRCLIHKVVVVRIQEGFVSPSAAKRGHFRLAETGISKKQRKARSICAAKTLH